MEDFIDSKEKVKDWIKKLKEYKDVGNICWVKKMDVRLHIEVDNNKGRQYRIFKYALQNTWASSEVYIAKVWTDEGQEFFEKLWRKVKRRYKWEKFQTSLGKHEMGSDNDHRRGF